MHFEVAVLPLDDEQTGLHVDGLQRDVGDVLDLESGRDLHDQRRHVQSRQEPADEGAEIAERLSAAAGR